MFLLHVVSFTLVMIGALNWGLIGLFNYNLVESIGLPMGVVKTVYVLVGLAAVYKLMMHSSNCKTCMEMMGDGKKKKK